jgi:hypothetical protein
MFGTNWSDPQTLWLNITNLALGLVTLAALAVVGASIARELLMRRRHAHELDGLDAEMHHMMHSPELGWTMADGGTPLKPADEQSEDRKR